MKRIAVFVMIDGLIAMTVIGVTGYGVNLIPRFRIQPLQPWRKPNDQTCLSTFASGQGHRPSHNLIKGITFTRMKIAMIKIISLIPILPFQF